MTRTLQRQDLHEIAMVSFDPYGGEARTGTGYMPILYAAEYLGPAFCSGTHLEPAYQRLEAVVADATARHFGLEARS